MLPGGLPLWPRVRNLAQCIVHHLRVVRRPTREREEIVQLRLDLGQQLPWIGLLPQCGQLRLYIGCEHARVTETVKRRACLVVSPSDARSLSILRYDDLLGHAHHGLEEVVVEPHHRAR